MNRAEVSAIASNARDVCERLGTIGYDHGACCRDVSEILRCVVQLADVVQSLADAVASDEDGP